MLKTKLKAQQPLQKIVHDKITKDDEAVIQYLKCAYYLAKRELPKEEMKHQVEFASAVGAPFPEFNNTQLTYTSNRSVTEFQHALAEVILDDRMSRVKRSGVFSIVIDESTDRGNDKRVLMYCQSVGSEGLLDLLV